MTKNEQHPLVAALLALHHQKERGSAPARAMLANLRNDARTNRVTYLLPFVLQHITEHESEEDAMLFASLFALHPMEQSSERVPQILRRRGSGSDGGLSPSFELRMRALLSASREDLVPHLRSIVDLAADGEVTALNWVDLFHAIRHWDANEEGRHSVKRWWARYFWAPRHAAQLTDSHESAQPSPEPEPEQARAQ